MDRGTLKFAGRRVNLDTFKPEGKDLRRLVGICSCGQRLVGAKALPQPDPYASDVHGDYTPVVICPHCHAARCDDV